MKLDVRLSGAHAIPLRRHQGGFVAEGPGFYIWDEDPNEVLRVARDLGRGRLDAKPTARFLVVGDGPSS